MKKVFFETEQDGFYGTYYENPNRADCAMIGLFGDDPNDYMAKCGARDSNKVAVDAWKQKSWYYGNEYSGYGAETERTST